jgi:hypothetical protein
MTKKDVSLERETQKRAAENAGMTSGLNVPSEANVQTPAVAAFYAGQLYSVGAIVLIPSATGSKKHMRVTSTGSWEAID